MKARIILIIALLCGFAWTAWGETITKTYLFGGSRSGITCHGYFYEEGKPNAHYNCFPNPWDYGSTASIHATLPGGITINFADSKKRIITYLGNAIGGGGDVTLTVGGGTNNYYIWHVTLYNMNGAIAFDETNWGADVESTHTFSKTISSGYFSKLVITYSTEDIFLINDSTTTIEGLDESYIFAGSDVRPEFEVVCNGRTLDKYDHYTFGYKDCSKPGTANLHISGVSPFHGNVSKDYTIIDPETVPVVWTAGSTVELTEDYTATSNINVTGTGNVKLVIAEGVKLTAKKCINIAEGATLTVEGPGSLSVVISSTGAAGSGGCDGADGEAAVIGSLIVNGGRVIINCGKSFGGKGGKGGNGGTGEAGVKGSLTVNGGSVTVKGGTGGDGGTGYAGKTGGKGGDGGDGVSGSLTVNGGTVTITSGQGGKGGHGGPQHPETNVSGNGGTGGTGGTGVGGSLTVTGGYVSIAGHRGSAGGAGKQNGSSGKNGYAVGGPVTCTAPGYVIQNSMDAHNWYDQTSGSTINSLNLRVVEIVNYTITAHQATLAGRTHYWTTFYHPDYNYKLPAGAQAFWMRNDHTLCRYGDGTIVPAGCPAVIMADTPSLSLTMTGSSAESDNGILQGTWTDTVAPAGAHVLSQVDGVFGFFEFSGTIPANKAFYVQ